MRLPWLKTVYVPVSTTDTRPYKEKWCDDDYLKQVAAMAGNSVFITETMELLKAARLAADGAANPEELKGVQKCIALIRQVITAPEKAKRTLERYSEDE
jgi:hypothetical protein